MRRFCTSWKLTFNVYKIIDRALSGEHEAVSRGVVRRLLLWFPSKSKPSRGCGGVDAESAGTDTPLSLAWSISVNCCWRKAYAEDPERKTWSPTTSLSRLRRNFTFRAFISTNTRERAARIVLDDIFRAMTRQASTWQYTAHQKWKNSIYVQTLDKTCTLRMTLKFSASTHETRERLRPNCTQT